jgi:hypothetical protein
MDRELDLRRNGKSTLGSARIDALDCVLKQLDE